MNVIQYRKSQITFIYINMHVVSAPWTKYCLIETYVELLKYKKRNNIYVCI